MVFVIDDTGSMADEIEVVKNTAVLLAEQFGRTCTTSVQCIVSPFNDPGKSKHCSFWFFERVTPFER